MHYFCLILTLFLTGMAQADSFKIAGSSYDFTLQGKVLYYGCDKSCDALRIISKHNKISLKEIRKGQKVANSVGSDVCANVYQAESVLGEALNGDRRAFCLFKDKSMVELNSLSDYLVEQKIVRE